MPQETPVTPAVVDNSREHQDKTSTDARNETIRMRADFASVTGGDTKDFEAWEREIQNEAHSSEAWGRTMDHWGRVGVGAEVANPGRLELERDDVPNVAMWDNDVVAASQEATALAEPTELTPGQKLEIKLRCLDEAAWLKIVQDTSAVLVQMRTMVQQQVNEPFRPLENSRRYHAATERALSMSDRPQTAYDTPSPKGA